MFPLSNIPINQLIFPELIHTLDIFIHNNTRLGSWLCLYNYTVMYMYIHVYTHKPSHLQDHYYIVFTNVCCICNIYLYIMSRQMEKACNFIGEILSIKYPTKQKDRN